ncbi:uncharacterized protein LOC121835021 [Ixodes scapularis]|uniref:uncharacterized protein LOC121835021 n=1 Tax=Ixodes scapularis TaxID=6945 RepID=UPI001C38101C|nr:uncharacterized protein LOC121835021 [Ixodes scapularis]
MVPSCSSISLQLQQKQSTTASQLPWQKVASGSWRLLQASVTLANFFKTSTVGSPWTTPVHLKKCRKTRYFQSVCQSRDAPQEQDMKEIREVINHDVIPLKVTTDSKHLSIFVDLDVERASLRFSVDTGSSVSILAENVHRQWFCDRLTLASPSVTLMWWQRGRPSSA